MRRDRRILFVHAHPDDESINNGATMAHYASAGAHVALVTCTLGEEGEILVSGLAGLAADQADQLGGWRIAELSSAMAALGVADHRFLGGAGRFRDSGMLGTPPNEHPRAFWRAASDPAVFAAAVAELVAVISDIRPQVLVTYDEHGGYGHPDHVMAHRIAMAAVADADWKVAKVYCNAVPASVAAELVSVSAGQQNPFSPTPELPQIADELVTTAVAAPAAWPAKRDALAAHATQVTVRDEWYALSNDLGLPISATEYYRLVQGRVGGERDANGRETDLFGGLGDLDA